MSAPRIRPLARPIRVPTPETSLVRKPSAIAGVAPRSPPGRRPVRPRSRRRARRPRCRSPRRSTALIWSACSVTPRTVATTTTAITASRPRTIRPAARVGLSPWRSRLPDQGLEDHGQHGREGQREHDLAHRRQRDDHDDRRHHEPDEAPSQDAKPGHRTRAVHRDPPLLGARSANPRIPSRLAPCRAASSRAAHPRSRICHLPVVHAAPSGRVPSNRRPPANRIASPESYDLRGLPRRVERAGH